MRICRGRSTRLQLNRMSRGRPTKIADLGEKSESIPRSTNWSARNAVWTATTAIGLAVILGAIYGRAMDVPFVFDDRASIIENDSIMRLWPLVGSGGLAGPLNPPREIPTSGRPLVNLSLAINYGLGELEPWGY